MNLVQLKGLQVHQIIYNGRQHRHYRVVSIANREVRLATLPSGRTIRLADSYLLERHWLPRARGKGQPNSLLEINL